MSSLFSLDNILVNESYDRHNRDSSIDISHITTDTDIEDFSFMNETYSFLLEYTKEYNTADKVFYKNILESCGDPTVINESFSDFFSKVQEIIKKFIDFIKRLFAQFSAKMHSMFKSEKYLKKNGKEFIKFTDDDNFDIKGYKFTVSESNIPVIGAKSAYFSSSDGNNNFTDLNINDLAGKSTKYSSDEANKASNLKQYVDNKYKELEKYLEDWYDVFRGEVIGSDSSISSSKFEDELFKVFRGGDSDKIDITIDSNYVSDAYNRFENYKSTIDSLNKTKRDIESDYASLESLLKRSFASEKTGDGVLLKFNLNSPRTYSNTEPRTYSNTEADKFKGGYSKEDNPNIFSQDVYTSIDLYMKAKVKQIQQMSNIHTLACTAKIQAVKDCFVQDKKVLYKALSKIKGHKNQIS